MRAEIARWPQQSLPARKGVDGGAAKADGLLARTTSPQVLGALLARHLDYPLGRQPGHDDVFGSPDPEDAIGE